MSSPVPLTLPDHRLASIHAMTYEVYRYRITFQVLADFQRSAPDPVLAPLILAAEEKATQLWHALHDLDRAVEDRRSAN